MSSRNPHAFRKPHGTLGPILGSPVLLAALVVTAHAGKIGGMDFAGDPAFDSDRIACKLEPVRRWLSHPGGRLCLNPSSHREFRIDPLAADLPLDLGAYAGTEVIRIPGVLTARVVPADPSLAGPASAPVETWFPYQIGFESKQAGGASVSGFDFFPDASPALIRVLQVKGPADSMLSLAGKATSGTAVRGNPGKAVVTSSAGSCHYALAFRRLEGAGLTPAAIIAKPAIEGDRWQLDLPISGGSASYAIGFGFATSHEGLDAAIDRANKILLDPVEASRAKAKAGMDRLLRKVPKPAETGLGATAVSAERHLLAYYMAWTFLFQSTIDPLPENTGYPYPQMSLGKGALWAEGHPKCPATCGWESFLGIQWLAMIDPEFGWQAYQGIMSLVDDDGMLGGESLPSRKAHTAWVLFQQQPDRQRLAAVYPSIRRYLLWREKNPRWIYGNNAAPDEKDIEFATSWMVDVEYAVRIAETLGLQEDAAQWRSLQATMRGNMKSWFFRDPEKLHQFFFTGSGVHATPQRNEYRPVMILSALATPRLPGDMRERLMALFDSSFNPRSPNAGFAYTKYPDNQFIAWGLIDHGMPQARPFITAVLRDSILCGEFAETIEISKEGIAMPGGVKPSLFTALNIIEFTWLLNGVRQDSGIPVPCNLPGKPPSP